MNIEKASIGISDAIINQDAIQLARLADRLKGYEPEQTKAVLSAVREKILNSYGITVDANGDFLEGEEDEVEEESDEEDSDVQDIQAEDIDAFAQEALVALIDERVTLLLIQNRLIVAPESLSPSPLPLDAPVIAGSAATVGATAIVSSDAPSTDVSAEDDWVEG